MGEFADAAVVQVEGLAVIVTLGAAGAVGCARGQALQVAAPRVDVVDSTGAGDAFVGVLAAALDGGAGLEVAMRRAVAAGSLACTAHGAQRSLPDRAAINTLLPLVTMTQR